MRFKKTAIGVILLLIIISLNQYKRQDVFTLTDQGREVPDCVKVLFFNDFMADNLPCSALSGGDARNLLHKIKHESFRTNIGIVHPNNRLHGIMGSLCVTPEWMSFLPSSICKNSNWAMTELATKSSMGVPIKTMRSFSNRL